MSLQDAFSRQFQAFHTAIIDDCDRAAGSDRTDSMALRLRNNALALTRMQLAMLALTRAEPCTPEPVAEPEPDPEPALAWEPEPSEAGQPDPAPFDCGRILAGDVLSRFVSRRLGPDESPHDIWQDMQETDTPQRRRNPALPRAGFRSPSG